MANLDIFESEGINQHVLGHEGAFRATLEKLIDLPIVGDVRGDGYFYGIELVKDKATKETFDDVEAEKLLRGFLSKALFEAGLYCRADDRGDPVIQLSPPLICDQEHFDEIEQILRSVLDEATKLLSMPQVEKAEHDAGGLRPALLTTRSRQARAYVASSVMSERLQSLQRGAGRQGDHRRHQDVDRDRVAGAELVDEERRHKAAGPPATSDASW